MSQVATTGVRGARQPDLTPERGRAGAADMVRGGGAYRTRCSPDVVPGVLPLFASAREFALDVHEHQRQRRGSRALSEPNPGDGGRADLPPIQCQGVAATSPASSGLTRSGAEKATERGRHDPIPHPDSQDHAITDSCTGSMHPCKAGRELPTVSTGRTRHQQKMQPSRNSGSCGRPQPSI